MTPSIRDLKEIVGRWPWPRAVSAMLIDYLHRGAPKVIAVDIGFWEKEREASYQFNGEAYTSARSDGDLAEAVKRAGNVVLLADAVDPGLVGSEVPFKKTGLHRRIVWARTSKNGRSSRCPTTCWRRRPQGSDTTSSPLTVTVPLGESLLSCARGRDSCPPSAWPRHSSPVVIGAEDVALEGRAIRIRDRRRPARSRAGHRRRRPVEGARAADDAHQLSRATSVKGCAIVSDLRSPSSAAVRRTAARR